MTPNARLIASENAHRLQAAATHGHSYASIVAACGHGYEVKLTGNGEQRAAEFARRKAEPCPDCAKDYDNWLNRQTIVNWNDHQVGLCWNGDGRPIHGYAKGKPMCLPCFETAKKESVRL